MTTPSKIRDLAQRLLDYEAFAGNASEPGESATLRVYEKLRQGLGEFAGVAGFQSLASRALTLARAEVPSLSAVQVTADGSIQGLGELSPQSYTDHAESGGAILIAQLLGLLRTFIGEALTLRLVRDLWPDAAFDDPNFGDGEKHEYTR